MRAAALLVAAIVLAGCGSSREELAADDHATCASYGFKYGTQAYGECRFAMDQNRQQREAMEDARRAQAGAAMVGVGTTMMQPRTSTIWVMP